MFERDHIMRQINMLSQAIARAATLRAESREAEALKELDAALDELSGSLEPKSSSPVSLFQLCVDASGELMPFAYDVAWILTVKGDSLIASGRIAEARRSYLEALEIYRAGLRRPSSGVPWDIRERMDGLEERLQDAGSDEL
ncbi:MAG TPA: hypothetical protein VMO47_05180 [Rhodothermales bacterium]|nr:hypothetical protein [Rhodothermales bacterium]